MMGTLSDKIKKETLTAVIEDTNKWGTIPMVKEGDGCLFAARSKSHLEIEDVEYFIRQLKKEMHEHWLEECHDCSCEWVITEALDKLAGEKLK